MSSRFDQTDSDPVETQEWLDSIENLIDVHGLDRANYILTRLAAKVTDTGAPPPVPITTPYRNTIPPDKELPYPGDWHLERRIRSMMRWNALAMVSRANQKDGNLGGHISTFASSATLYDVGFNHFFSWSRR